MNQKASYNYNQERPAKLETHFAEALREGLEKLSKTTLDFQNLVEFGSQPGIHNFDYEHLLVKLSCSEVREIDGALQLIPVFSSLPVFAQIRFLYILQTKISLIPLQSLLNFIDVIKITEVQWVQEMIRQLTTLAENSFSTSSHCVTNARSLSYKFSSSSTQSFNNILKNLNRVKDTAGTIIHNDIEQPSKDVVISQLTGPSSDQIVDVIIIEDDSHSSQISDKHRDNEMKKHKIQESVKTIDRKNKASDIITNVDNLNYHFVNENWNKKIFEDGENEIISPVKKVCSYSVCPQIKLSQLCNACQSQDMQITLDMLKPFTDMTLSEIKLACEYLGFANLSDKLLVDIFDYMPWQDLKSSASSIILDSCLFAKFCNLQSDPSDRLLSAVMLIASTVPQVLVEIFISVLLKTNSGYFQSQLITSVCKESLSIEVIGLFIGQLLKEKVVCNDNLISVLHALISRNPGLDEESLMHLLCLLSQFSEDTQSNAKLGKVHLSVILRLGSMMSGRHLTVLSSIIDGHTSNMRKILLNAVKKIKPQQSDG
ncbi:hypothetical protein Btru_018429 [Bulinus truncatus]|nr:hypothetical protein Btru_018429 [Bulinus truncatus]